MQKKIKQNARYCPFKFNPKYLLRWKTTKIKLGKFTAEITRKMIHIHLKLEFGVEKHSITFSKTERKLDNYKITYRKDNKRKRN